MEKKKVYAIPGTMNSSLTGQSLISSGVAALDSLIGGGLPVGTVAFIEEDVRGIYSKVLLKYFLVEGVMVKHPLLVASQDIDPSVLINDLPGVIENPDTEIKSNVKHDKELKIAFRYQNLTAPDESRGVKNFNHHYDLSEQLSNDYIQNADIEYWRGDRKDIAESSFANPKFNDLLKAIKDKIKNGKFFLKDSPEEKKILRIGIHSLGSPMWLPPHPQLLDPRDLPKFFFCLRALIRSARAVALVTVPTFIYDHVCDYTVPHANMERCIHSSDIAMKFHSFTGTEFENHKILRDYHGFFYLTKLAAINSFVSHHPGAIEYVYKLRLKKLCLSVLHLPPHIEENNDNNASLYNCSSAGSGKSKFTDF